jgi:hypothetical protein
MKGIQKFAAVNVIAALLGAGVPAMAAQRGHEAYGRAGVQSQSIRHRNDREWNDGRAGYTRNDDRWDRDYYDNRRDRGPGYIYAPAPAYREPVYDNRYDYHRTHNGRTAAIIGGSAAAGALIGAAVGHGQGAAIGAVVGGLAGTVASAAADHHDRY